MTDLSSSQITIRVLSDQDSGRLLRLAERDSASVPTGTVLAAERNGHLIAAVTIGAERPEIVADPFEVTTDAVALLLIRIEQIRGEEFPSRRRIGRLRPPRRARAALAGSPPGGGSHLLRL